MQKHPKQERSLVLIKPDGLQRNLVGEILKRLERVGLKMTALKMLVAQEDQIWEHYNKDDAWFQIKGEGIVENRKKMKMPIEKEAIDYGRDIIDVMVKYMTSSPIIAIIVEGNEATQVVTKLVGGTEPTTSDIGTIRGDYAIDSYQIANIDGRAVRNLIHCSEDPEEAEREIKIWFDKDEIIAYRHVGERMLYDVNLDGILE